MTHAVVFLEYPRHHTDPSDRAVAACLFLRKAWHGTTDRCRLVAARSDRHVLYPRRGVTRRRYVFVVVLLTNVGI